MNQQRDIRSFPAMNRAYRQVFKAGRLTLGLVVPLDAYPGSPVPDMRRHLERAQLADRLGFAALWLRDVPFNVPSFGDAGQTFDPFVYLGTLAAVTDQIAVGVASLILPLRHPAHVAKAAASADVLSGGRLLLGVASGDRPQEYPALAMDFENRGARFRDAFAYVRKVFDDYPTFSAAHGTLSGNMDMLPKPTVGQIPLLVTGGSRQTPEWVAEHADGWITYPRPPAAQAVAVAEYRGRVTSFGSGDRPVTQSLYVDLLEDIDAAPAPIHLGFRSGIHYLEAHLRALEAAGVNHVALNLRFNGADIEGTMERLAEHLLPQFSTR
ncbi:MAG: LLM class oxidoreductase [Pseudomonadota bacterium]